MKNSFRIHFIVLSTWLSALTLRATAVEFDASKMDDTVARMQQDVVALVNVNPPTNMTWASFYPEAIQIKGFGLILSFTVFCEGRNVSNIVEKSDKYIDFLSSHMSKIDQVGADDKIVLLFRVGPIARSGLPKYMSAISEISARSLGRYIKHELSRDDFRKTIECKTLSPTFSYSVPLFADATSVK